MFYSDRLTRAQRRLLREHILTAIGENGPPITIMVPAGTAAGALPHRSDVPRPAGPPLTLGAIMFSVVAAILAALVVAAVVILVVDVKPAELPASEALVPAERPDDRGLPLGPLQSPSTTPSPNRSPHGVQERGASSPATPAASRRTRLPSTPPSTSADALGQTSELATTTTSPAPSSEAPVEVPSPSEEPPPSGEPDEERTDGEPDPDQSGEDRGVLPDVELPDVDVELPEVDVDVPDLVPPDDHDRCSDDDEDGEARGHSADRR